MRKPGDIPQDVWNIGAKMAREYLFWLNAGNSTGNLSEHAVAAMADTIARAILAERERCATIADQFELGSPDQESEFVNKHLGYNWDAGFDAGCTLVARAIREASNV